jgi:hypothetical protein
MILKVLQRLDQGFEDVEACMYVVLVSARIMALLITSSSREMDFNRTHLLLHYYRGICNSIGLFKVRDGLDQIYWYQRDEDQQNCNVQTIFLTIIETVRRDYDVVNMALRNFYKSAPSIPPQTC